MRSENELELEKVLQTILGLTPAERMRVGMYALGMLDGRKVNEAAKEEAKKNEKEAD